VPVQPTIDGALPEQRRLLEEILVGLGSTRIQGIFLYPYRPRFEDMHEPPPGDYGDVLGIEVDADDRRAFWEGTLAAYAFARRSAAEGMRKVAWFSLPGQGHGLENPGETVEPLSTGELEDFRAAVVAAAVEARLEQVDVLQPQAHALALAVSVDEPHAFLRFHVRDFLRALGGWRARCDGIYAEVRDSAPEHVLLVGWHRRGGFSSSRRDVACCAPMLGLGYPGMPPPPRCPVFD
jgi:hypothetical protein